MIRRNTEQKKAVFEIIGKIGIHKSAEEVKAELDAKGLSIGLATVYRNLNLLCEEGIIQRYVNDGFNYYDGNPSPHDHLHCINCGSITDIEAPYNKGLDAKATKDTKAKILSHSATFEGICEKCMKK